LKTVGMAAFVGHLGLFEGPLSHGLAAAELQERMQITAKSSLSRTTHARAILSAGRKADALALIAASARVDEKTRAAARASR